MCSDRTSIPLPVRRQLRQEVAFGCPICGNPILDYHHIIPISELEHNDPDHMVALCPTHHRESGKLRREKAYKLKREPINLVNGNVRGLLGTNRTLQSFRLGTSIFINTPKIFVHRGRTILEHVIQDGQNLVSAFIPGTGMVPDLLIQENDFSASVANFWDIEFRTNYLKVALLDRTSWFELDFRSEHAVVNLNLNIEGRRFLFNPNTSIFGGSNIRVTATDCFVGYEFGG
ncbi:MAG: HNH endonuclease signature motif containing protein [Gemmobacter sp.]